MNIAIDTLFIDPDLDARLRFKQASQMIGVKVSVSTSTTLIEALQRLDSLRSCDIVYVSSRFDSEVLSGFVASARRTRQGKNVAFMMMVPAPECEMNSLAKFALAGADGFLLEPYSASGLESTIRTGLIARHKRKISSQRIAVELLVKAMVEGLRDYRKQYKARVNYAPARARIDQTRSIIKNLDEATFNEYIEILSTKLIDKSKPYQETARSRSSGTTLSRRVVRRAY